MSEINTLLIKWHDFTDDAQDEIIRHLNIWFTPASLVCVPRIAAHPKLFEELEDWLAEMQYAYVVNKELCSFILKDEKESIHFHLTWN